MILLSGFTGNDRDKLATVRQDFLMGKTKYPERILRPSRLNKEFCKPRI